MNLYDSETKYNLSVHGIILMELYEKIGNMSEPDLMKISLFNQQILISNSEADAFMFFTEAILDGADKGEYSIGENQMNLVNKMKERCPGIDLSTLQAAINVMRSDLCNQIKDNMIELRAKLFGKTGSVNVDGNILLPSLLECMHYIQNSVVPMMDKDLRELLGDRVMDELFEKISKPKKGDI